MPYRRLIWSHFVFPFASLTALVACQAQQDSEPAATPTTAQNPASVRVADGNWAADSADVPARPDGRPAEPAISEGVMPGSASSNPSMDNCRPALTPEAEKGIKGATHVLLNFASALENRQFACAASFWRVGAGGPTAVEMARQYDGLTDITVSFGTGSVEGGAGSLFYEVPISVTGKRADGGIFQSADMITLRRVNDVDGASEDQLKWHIVGLQPNI